MAALASAPLFPPIPLTRPYTPPRAVCATFATFDRETAEVGSEVGDPPVQRDAVKFGKVTKVTTPRARGRSWAPSARRL